MEILPAAVFDSNKFYVWQNSTEFCRWPYNYLKIEETKGNSNNIYFNKEVANLEIK